MKSPNNSKETGFLPNLERDLLLKAPKAIVSTAIKWAQKSHLSWHEVKLEAEDGNGNTYRIIVLQSSELPTRFDINLTAMSYLGLTDPQFLFRVNTTNVRVTTSNMHHKDKWRKKRVEGPHVHFYDEDAVLAGFNEEEPADSIEIPIVTLEDGVHYFCRRGNVEDFWELIRDGAF